MKSLTNCFYALAVLLVVNCEPAPDDLFKKHFTIEQGEHYSTPRLVETLQGNRLVFTATFDESAIYTFADAKLQPSKNKLLGFSDCNSRHHENSARFAWQWYNERLEIYAYCYVNGKRKIAFLETAEISQENVYEIALTGDHYVFRLNNGPAVSIERGSTCDTGMYYMLWPYFGGTLPAPHDIHITISIKR